MLPKAPADRLRGRAKTATGQVCALLRRKELTLKRRRPITTICEILLPVGLCSLVLLSKLAASTQTEMGNTTYTQSSYAGAVETLGPQSWLEASFAAHAQADDVSLILSHFNVSKLAVNAIPPLALFLLYASETGAAPFDGSFLAVAPDTAEVRQLLALQFWAVMHHPQFQRAESTWRGLRLLLRKCNFRKGLQLDLLDVSWADAAQAFSLHVHEPEMAGTSSLTPSLVVLDYPMGVGNADLEQCQAMAEQAEEVQVTLLTSVELGFFGLDEPAGINDLRLVSSLLDEPQYTKFRALRDKDCARWLGVAQGRFLLRQPYLQGDRGAGGMAEPVAASSDLLWGSPVWLVAALVARSQAEVGWPTEITGLQSGSVEDLPTHIFPGPGGRDMHIPLEAFASQTLGDDLAHRGFIAVTCAPEGDSAYLLRAPILHPPGHFSDPGATDNARRMATLGYQLLVSRMADLLGRHKAQLVSGKGPGEIQAGLQGFFSSLVGGSGQGAGATVNLGQSGNRMLAEIQIRMGREVMNGVSVNFTIPV